MQRTLKTEDRIAHFVVVGPLGAGGMGEVYRARDESLERDVALKVLPPEVVQSEERVRRFTLEAKSASSLNHPHIVHIYEIGEDRVRGDGATDPTSGSLHYIAMELVSGTTLAAKIHSEKADPKILLGWLAQAAEGVAKAHAAGIVHRDLKPGNIMVSNDGYAKVLDFGLAKLTEHTSPESDMSEAATMTAAIQTDEGVALGTVGYMAPEQVRGLAVDARADVFAFGCMLYEAVTRRQPFAAETKVETMHRILHDAPTPVEELNPEVPAELRRLIRRCLAKDSNQRVDSMRTLALELREIVADYDALSAASSSSNLATGVLPTKERRLHSLPWIGAAFLITLIAVAVFVLQGPPRINPGLRTRAVDVRLSDLGWPALSGDGRWIAAPGSNHDGVSGLYLVDARGGDARPVVMDSSATVTDADFSPDGSQILYGVTTSNGSEIRVVPALGGTAKTLAREGYGADWSPDGRIGYVLGPWQTHRPHFEFWTMRADGTGRTLTWTDSVSEVGWIGPGFTWSPDGKRIAWLRNFEHASYAELVIHDLVTGRDRQLTHDHKAITTAVWTPRNEIVFASNRGGATNLWMMRASGGPATQITRGAGPDHPIGLAADGRTVLYGITRTLSTIGWWDVVTGDHGRVTGDDQPYATPIAPSPDGRQIVIHELDADQGMVEPSLVIMNRDGTGRRTVVSGDQKSKSYDWSPDGRYIAWDAVKSGNGDSLTRHIVDAQTGEELSLSTIPTSGAFGLMFWFTPDTIRSSDNRGVLWYSVSRRRVVGRSDDFEYIYPNLVPGWRVFQRRLASTPTGVYVRPERGGAERFVMPDSWRCARPGNDPFLYCWPESLGFRRLELPSGRLSAVAHGPPEGKAWFAPARDGRTVFWIKEHPVTRLALIENLH